MKIPARDIHPWAAELVRECLTSRETRRQQYRLFKSYYYTGTADGTGTLHNKCYNQVDKLSSYLFSPADVRFALSTETGGWDEEMDVAAKHVNGEFDRGNCGIAFGQGVDVALVNGCGFMKVGWSSDGYEPFVIQPQFMGVLREDIEDLDRQEAFVHSYYLTPSQLRRLIADHPDVDEIMARTETASDVKAEAEIGSDYFHEIVMGGVAPLAFQPESSTGKGNVVITSVPMPQLAPEVAQRLIRVDELWAWDDKRADWTTVRIAAPDIVLEGQYKHRNLSDIPGEQPFVKICASDEPGYFWGRSEMSGLVGVQDRLTSWINSIDNILRKQANPPRAFLGSSSITPEKMRALLSAGGTMTDDSPTAKIETMAPTMPAQAVEYLGVLEGFADDAGGFTNTTSGKGEQGVRSGDHAGTLLRTSSPRLRDKALRIEKQVAAVGDLCLRMSIAKNARVFKVPKPSANFLQRIMGEAGEREFMLSQLPKDVRLTVDSHTSSPAFSGDNVQLAFALAKAQAIDGRSLLELTHPPHQDELIERFAERQAKQE